MLSKKFLAGKDRTKSRPGPLKLQLDSRTVITLSGTKLLDFWMHRYPGARVVR
jgi:hypothetical protein